MNILHLIHLYSIGGIERSYTEFINHSVDDIPVNHHTLLTRGRIDPVLEDLVVNGSASIHHLKKVRGLKIPRWPDCFRKIYYKRILDRTRPDIILFWSNPKYSDIFNIDTPVPRVYWERGASWLKAPRYAPEMQKMLTGMAGVICNSYASKRMLELKWSIPETTKIKVCLNAVRPHCIPQRAFPKIFPSERPFRLGIAGRLVAIKGIPLAIHALAQLRRRNTACELWVAGTGPESDRLKNLAIRLNIAEHVKFIGLVKDMSDFYNQIDCLLCPSIREPFGLVCAEAMIHGCPVIAAKVDGLPEVVTDSETGFCLPPTLNADRYGKYGGDPHNLPSQIYDPENDTIASPGFVDPEIIAETIKNMVMDPQGYQELSASAITSAEKKFNFDNHVRSALSFLKEIVSGASVETPTT